MNPHRYDRLFVAFVVLGLAGLGLGGSIHQLTISSSNGHLAQVLAKPAPTRSWIGAYLELSSFGCFLAFAVWASAKLGGGALGQFARAAGTSYATVSIASLAVVDALSYRAGKGIVLQREAARGVDRQDHVGDQREHARAARSERELSHEALEVDPRSLWIAGHDAQLRRLDRSAGSVLGPHAETRCGRGKARGRAGHAQRSRLGRGGLELCRDLLVRRFDAAREVMRTLEARGRRCG
jgi:hypothetical protein